MIPRKAWHLIIGAALALFGGRYAWMRYQRGRWQVVSYDLAAKAMIAADPTHAASYRLLPKDGVVAPTGPLTVGTPVFFALRRDNEDVAAGFIAAGTVVSSRGGNVVVAFTNGAYEADMSREIPYVPLEGTLYIVRTEDVRPAGPPMLGVATPGGLPLGINAIDDAWYLHLPGQPGVYLLTGLGQERLRGLLQGWKCSFQQYLDGAQQWKISPPNLTYNEGSISYDTFIGQTITETGSGPYIDRTTIDRLRDEGMVYAWIPAYVVPFVNRAGFMKQHGDQVMI